VIIGVDPGVNTSSALSSVIDTIDPASCPAATREYSVRAEALRDRESCFEGH
jgi:hypothetical protein